MSRNNNGIILNAFLVPFLKPFLYALLCRVGWTTKHPNIFVAKEDPTLALRGAGVRRGIGLTNLKVGLYINVRAFL